MIEISALVTNGLAHHYHLVVSTSIFRDTRSDFIFYSAASYLGLYCLPESHWGSHEFNYIFSSMFISTQDKFAHEA